jgi:plastocyanin
MSIHIRQAWRRLGTALVGVAAAVLISMPAGLGQDDTVVITSTLEPASVEVAPGAAVTWRNDDSERHRIRSREGPERFDSGDLEPGERFTFTFTVVGTYPYLDHRDDDDPAYFGTIVVSAGPADPSSGAELATSGAVTIGDRVFIPPTIAIATGGTVEWTNTDSDSHTATSADGAFDSGVLATGATFAHTFDTPGSYPFFCAIHPEMQGTISVADPAGAPSPGATTSPAAASLPPSASISPDPSATASATPVASSATITLADRAFDPTTVEVPVGGSVEWLNQDEEGHTATASDASFDSGVIGPGESFTQTFDTVGAYDFFCAIHPEMQGTITVVEAPGPSPPSG